MYIPNFGLVETLETGQQTNVHVISQQAADFLKHAAISEAVADHVVCDTDPSVTKYLDIQDGEAAICLNGLVSGIGSAMNSSPANRVLRAAMAEAEAAGYDLIDPEWYEHMTAPAGRNIRMSSIGLNPAQYGWSLSSRYPKNSLVQGRAAVGLVRFMSSRDPEDLYEVEGSLVAEGGKLWSLETSVPAAVEDGVQAMKYLQDHPGDLKGAFHATAKGLFQPWNR